MAVFQIHTQNQEEIGRKPRVYFTCHPEDFHKYFEKICNDIFKSHDCAIYYTADMKKNLSDEDKVFNLGRSQLLVVPVTYRLLTTASRAMDEDIPYARAARVPILPILVEPNLDQWYSDPQKFGDLQYLSTDNSDLTQITYGDKLKKYLKSVLISDTMLERIRSAFDAYIFLSYRKKDRHYANELMRLIHSNPRCRDIAVWFDEFLTPGENFRESIDRILRDSELFALLVTPSLLEEPNFVMDQEYPAACQLGLRVLPAQMQDTDKELLREKYRDIPDCINPEGEEFHTRLLDSITRLAAQPNNDPEHNYLIGLAYLDGIDVEVDRERALELISSAAKAGLPEAMKKMHSMRREGTGADHDYAEAVVWAKKYAEYVQNVYGENHMATLKAYSELGLAYLGTCEYRSALEVNRWVYERLCRFAGEDDPNAIEALRNVAHAYSEMCEYWKALDTYHAVYERCCRVLGPRHHESMIALLDLAVIYAKAEEYKTALKCARQAHTLFCEEMGEAHPDTLTALRSMAAIYCRSGDYTTAAEEGEKAYALYKEVFGEENIDTISSLNVLAEAYYQMEDYGRAKALYRKGYADSAELLGEDHPYTVRYLDNLAAVSSRRGDHAAAWKLQTMAYTRRSNVLGQTHPDTLESLRDLVRIASRMGEYRKALELQEHLYGKLRWTYGEEHPLTMKACEELEKMRANC